MNNIYIYQIEVKMAFIQSQIISKSSIVEKIENILRSWIVDYKNYRLYKKTVSELNDLGGRELSDLGISRSMIRSVAFAAVYERKDSRRDSV